jgi:hypothetical protein
VPQVRARPLGASLGGVGHTTLRTFEICQVALGKAPGSAGNGHLYLVIDFQSVACDNSTRIGAVLRVVNEDGSQSCPKAVFSPVFGAKSLFRNTLHISHLNPKIWHDFLLNSMILKDRAIIFFRACHP